jgi:hypothetical protein
LCNERLARGALPLDDAAEDKMNRGWKQGRMVGSTGRFILSLYTTSLLTGCKKKDSY